MSSVFVYIITPLPKKNPVQMDNQKTMQTRKTTGFITFYREREDR